MVRATILPTQGYFCLMHLPTGKTMPPGGRGYTRREFTHNCPRIFRLHGHADNALRWFLEGKVRVYYSREGDEDWSVSPVAGRIPEEYAVVPITIHFDLPKAKGEPND